MVRKGWSVMELPSDGWVKVLRGRRLRSVQWLPAQKSPSKVESNHFSGEPRVGVPNGHEQGAQFPSSSQSSGPDEQVVREGLVATCQSGGAEARHTTNFSDTRFRRRCTRESCQVAPRIALGSHFLPVQQRLSFGGCARQERASAVAFRVTNHPLWRTIWRPVQCPLSCKFFGNPFFGERSHTC